MTMGTPRATAQRNLTVRRTRSVTRWVQSKTEVAMDPPSVLRATSIAGEATTPVKSACGHGDTMGTHWGHPWGGHHPHEKHLGT